MNKPPTLGLDAQVALLAIVTAGLTTAGNFLQKVNGVRAGSPYVSGWLALALVCFVPTFFITNRAFQLGGRMSLYMPLTAVQYVFAILAGRYYFGEVVSWDKWIGCLLIVAGVGAIMRG